MACERCIELPGAHMFLKFARINDIDYYYISAARAIDYKETDKTYSYFKSH